MNEKNVMDFLKNPIRQGENDAAEASTLQDFGFWDMSNWSPTPIGHALLSGEITWQECALLQISKRAASRKDSLSLKPLVILAKTLTLLNEKGVEDLWISDCQKKLYSIKSYDEINDTLINDIIAMHSSGNIDRLELSGDYIDIWINALVETRLFKKTSHGLAIEQNDVAKMMCQYIAMYGEHITPTPPKSRDKKSKDIYYSYMGAISTGLMEILPPRFIRNYFPSFLNLQEIDDPPIHEPTPSHCEHQIIQLQDRLTVALQLFITKRGSCQFNPVLPNEEVTAENYSYDQITDWEAFCTEVQESPSDISVCFASKVVKDLGMLPSLLTRFLVRLEPFIYATYSEQTVEALYFLELTKTKALPEDLTADAYESSKAIQTQIRDKMREMKILSQEGKEANYLTVAEFLWFVNDNKDLIEGKVMEKQFKPVNTTKVDEESREDKGLKCETTDDVLIFRLMAALRTKPFAILAGHSGTGKSRLVRKLAYMTCNVKDLQNTEKNSPENFCMVQVKPNWHDSMDLLGYRSAFEDKSYVTTDVVKFICKAYAYPKTPFFLCLDEMNLAPVEQYFAEFLSAMESLREMSDEMPYTSDTLFTLTDDELKSQSKLYDLGCETEVGQTYLTKRGGVTIPKNLFVVGTVNMDETTCQFSRKVLDRAMTIEMTDVNFANFGKVKDPSFEDLLAEDIVQLLLDGDIKVESLDAEDVDVNSKLCKLQECLKETSFAIAYRFAKEYTLFKRSIEEFKEHISGSPQKSEDESSEVAETPEDSKPSEASNSGMRETVENLDALDQMVLMKVLPRIMGRTEDVKALFTGVRDFNPKGSREAMEDSLLNIFGKTSKSGKKMIEIMGRGGSHLTFWP